MIRLAIQSNLTHRKFHFYLSEPILESCIGGIVLLVNSVQLLGKISYYEIHAHIVNKSYKRHAIEEKMRL